MTIEKLLFVMKVEIHAFNFSLSSPFNFIFMLSDHGLLLNEIREYGRQQLKTVGWG